MSIPYKTIKKTNPQNKIQEQRSTAIATLIRDCSKKIHSASRRKCNDICPASFDYMPKPSPRRGETFGNVPKPPPRLGKTFGNVPKPSPHRGETFDQRSKTKNDIFTFVK